MAPAKHTGAAGGVGTLLVRVCSDGAHCVGRCLGEFVVSSGIGASLQYDWESMSPPYWDLAMASDPQHPVSIAQHAQKVRQWFAEVDAVERRKGQLLIDCFGGDAGVMMEGLGGHEGQHGVDVPASDGHSDVSSVEFTLRVLETGLRAEQGAEVLVFGSAPGSAVGDSCSQVGDEPCVVSSCLCRSPVPLWGVNEGSSWDPGA